MRTTLTLTPEAESLVKQAMVAQGASLKEVVNRALITALAPRPAAPFTMATYPMRARTSLDHALALAGELEDVDLIRKREHGK
jgi:hypothetical protein